MQAMPRNRENPMTARDKMGEGLHPLLRELDAPTVAWLKTLRPDGAAQSCDVYVSAEPLIAKLKEIGLIEIQWKDVLEGQRNPDRNGAVISLAMPWIIFGNGLTQSEYFDKLSADRIREQREIEERGAAEEKKWWRGHRARSKARRRRFGDKKRAMREEMARIGLKNTRSFRALERLGIKTMAGARKAIKNGSMHPKMARIPNYGKDAYYALCKWASMRPVHPKLVYGVLYRKCPCCGARVFFGPSKSP